MTSRDDVTELRARSSAEKQTPSFTGSGVITEQDQNLAHIRTMALEYRLVAPVRSTATTYIGPEKEPEAAVILKPPLPDSCIPPIWAEVGLVGYSFLNHAINMTSSHDRKCANPLTLSGVFKVAFIMPKVSPKDTFLVGTPPGQLFVALEPNLADKLVAVIYSTRVGGSSSRTGKGFHAPKTMLIEAGRP